MFCKLLFQSLYIVFLYLICGKIDHFGVFYNFQDPEAEGETDGVMTPAQMVIIVIVAGFCFLLGTVSAQVWLFSINFTVSVVSIENVAPSFKGKGS